MLIMVIVMMLARSIIKVRANQDWLVMVKSVMVGW